VGFWRQEKVAFDVVPKFCCTAFRSDGWQRYADMTKQHIPIPSTHKLCTIFRLTPHTHIQVSVVLMDLEIQWVIKQHYLHKHNNYLFLNIKLPVTTY
jgi:hypothetical protein